MNDKGTQFHRNRFDDARRIHRPFHRSTRADVCVSRSHKQQPKDEKERLAALRKKLLLDTKPDTTLDAVTTMCAELFNIPVVLVSLLDSHRQWFKSRANFSVTETGRPESFCAWTLLPLDPKVLLVPDARKDPRFSENPLVVGEPHIRFYAGAPLLVDGFKLGTLCLIDFEPHPEGWFDSHKLQQLVSCAKLVSHELSKPAHQPWLGEAMNAIKEGVFLLDFAVSPGNPDGMDIEKTDDVSTSSVSVEDAERGVSSMSIAGSSEGHDYQNETPVIRKQNSSKSIKSICSSKSHINIGDTEGCIIYANNALKRMTQADVNDTNFENSVVGKTLVSMFGNTVTPETKAKLSQAQDDLRRAAKRRQAEWKAALRGYQQEPNPPTEMQVLETALKEYRSKDDDSVEYDIRIEVDVHLRNHEDPRRVVLSMTHLPMDKAGFQHMVVLATARDVTDEYKSKLQMKEAKEKSEAMVIAKSSFLANMSHEIRTPLNAIIAGSELLSHIPDLTAEQRELTDMVIRTSHTLLALVSDVLDFSKIEAEKLALNVKPFSIESCIDLSLEMQSIKANNKRLVLNYCIASNVPQRLLGDDMRIRQVVTNLISNAVKFTPKGSVELKIRALEQDEDETRSLKDVRHADAMWDLVTGEASGSPRGPSSSDSVTLLFEVIDTGIGIPPDDQSELFTAFHQVNSSRTRSQQGTGLGLAICLKLVRLMQGDMSLVSSGVGCGSRFAFTAKLGRDVQTMPSLSPVAAPLLGRTILVVSTCDSFVRNAKSLSTHAGLLPVVLNDSQARNLLKGSEGWGDAVGILIDREYIPKSAVLSPHLREEFSAMFNSEAVPGAGARLLGLKDKHVLDEADGKYFDSCSEFINMLNVAVMQHTRAYESSQQRLTCPDTLTPDTKGRRISSDAVTKPAPSVMVLTFSSACVLSDRVTVNAKPLISRNFVDWIVDVVEKWTLPKGAEKLKQKPNIRRSPSTVGLTSAERLEFQKQSTLFELEPDAKAQVRVLIAEDNLMNQKVAVKLLHSVGFRAAVVNNGKEALDLFVEKADAGESFDLILMDLQMPVMDGLQATREIFGHVLARPGLARPHIVALTADVAESVVEECKACQMHGFIAKPIKREKLNTLMEKITMWVMEGRQPQYELDGDGWTYR